MLTLNCSVSFEPKLYNLRVVERLYNPECKKLEFDLITKNIENWPSLVFLRNITYRYFKNYEKEIIRNFVNTDM